MPMRRSGYESRLVLIIPPPRRYNSHVVCSSAMPRRSIPTFARIRIVSLCQEGLSSREVSRRLRVNQNDVVRTWRKYRDTGTVDDMHRSDRPKATIAVDDSYLRISARRYPESNGTMLNNAFPATKVVVLRLKQYEIGYMMWNFIPGIHGEVHI